MALLRSLFARLKCDSTARVGIAASSSRSVRGVEPMEPRMLLAADTVYVGAVYIEEDIGSDDHGDTFELTFVGGADGTQLERVTISGDQNEAGFGVGDVFFDTSNSLRTETGPSRYGADHAVDFHVVQNLGVDLITPVYSDGGMLLEINFEGFHAGDKIVFSIDVDEVEDFDPAEDDFNTINDGFDPITSGVEFQGSVLTTWFAAANYEDATAHLEFRNRYDELLAGKGLSLSEDDKDGLRDRTAGTAGELKQRIIPAEISGHVYHDRNQNGRFDSDEDPISGVEVAIVPIDTIDVQQSVTVRTKDDGSYYVDGLSPGSYRIEESQPTGYLDGIDSAGSVDGVPSGNAINPGDLIDNIFLAGGSSGIDYDFGEIVAASLQGQVHLSTASGDCFGEDIFHEPVVGATIQLYNAAGDLVAETQTDVDGEYAFDNIVPGEYTVVELTPEGLLDGGAQSGSVTGQLRGTVITPNRISSIALGSGEDGQDYDFCDVEPVAIAGFVQIGTPDGDCFTEDIFHEPIPGVKIELFNGDGQLVSETTTDGQGRYQFQDLPPGIYRVVEHTPIDLLEGGARVGDIEGQPGGIVDDPSIVSQITLGPGQSVDVDFCELEPASIGGFVYHDRDNDGRFESDEQPIAFVEVLLWSGSDLVDIALTDADGAYVFENVEAGQYTIEEMQPLNWMDGKDAVGTIAGQLVGVLQEPDSIRNVTVKYGDRGINYNFGEIRPSVLRGNIHLGTPDGDCFSDSITHDPLEGVTVHLLDENGTIVATTETSSNGDYFFEDLLPGTYGIRELTPVGLIDGGAQVGTVDGIESGHLFDASNIVEIVLLSGVQAINYDFCEFLPSSISGYVYHDADGDADRGTDEAPIPGSRVILYDASGNVVDETITNERGYYEFAGLPAGKYRIQEVQPEGWLDGTDSAGTIDGVTTGFAENPGDTIRDITIGYGKAGIEFNFAELLPGTIAGFVHSNFEISDCEFNVEQGDELLAGVRVQLLDANGVILSEVLTDDSGRFEFTNLLPGDYTLNEIQPEGYFDGQSRRGDEVDDSIPNRITDIVLGSGETLDDFVFCEDPPVEISGFVFQDGPAVPLGFSEQLPEDVSGIRNGEFTADDVPISGVTLELRVGVFAKELGPEDFLPGLYYDGIANTVSDRNGFYQFTGLRKNTYAIYEAQPDGYSDGIDTGGTVSDVQTLFIPPAIAINQSDADELRPLTLSLEKDPGFDAIVRIQLPPGTKSTHNNFSEVIAERPIVPSFFLPDLAPADARRPLRNIESLRSVFSPIDIELFEIKSHGRVRGRGNTWHLSVIDGGTPRGEGEIVTNMGPEWFGNSLPNQLVTDAIPLVASEWTVIFDDGSTRSHRFGVNRGLPVVGDFNGDGIDEIGIYARGYWLIDINGNGLWDDADLWAKLGFKVDQPVTGDWDGDGKDDIGVFGPAWPGDPLAVHLEPGLPDRQNETTGETKNVPPPPEDASQVKRTMQLTATGEPRSDVIDHVFHFGGIGDRAVAGDWNGDGIATIGVFRDGHWILDRDGDGRFTDVDMHADFGRRNDIPIVGDFNGDGIDEIGIYRDGRFYLDTNGNRQLDLGIDTEIALSEDGYPVVGDWDGDGRDSVGIVRSAKMSVIELEARLPR